MYFELIVKSSKKLLITYSEISDSQKNPFLKSPIPKSYISFFSEWQPFPVVI